MKSAVRDQLRGRDGKAKVRRTLNRHDRRQAKVALHVGSEPTRTRRSLDRVLL
jgi:hypothetical protein